MSYLDPPVIRRAMRMAENRVLTGIRFIDEILLGICERDLVLLGARTGVGKTQIATNIALQLAQRGEETLFIALEAHEREIEDRAIYAKIVEAFFDKYPNGKPGVDLRYRAWRMGLLDSELGELENEVYERNKFTLAYIRSIYRGASFTIDDFVNTIDSCGPDISLIVLDHFHFLDNPDDNEMRGFKTAAQKIREAALRNKKPVLLLAHMRKTTRGEKNPIPDIDDFHGSSDLTKIATDVVIAARAEDFDTTSGGRATWLYVPKSREAGDGQGYAALVAYDPRKGAYGNDYYLARVRRFSEPEFLQASQMPRWAKSAKVYSQ